MRGSGRVSQIITRLHDDDARERGRGMPPGHGWQLSMGIEGTGAAPLGWPAWNYEQGNGYSRYTWAYSAEGSDVTWDEEDAWSFDEVGLHPHDFTDEMEDWDLSPLGRCRYATDYFSWEPDRRPLPEPPKKVEADDAVARGFDREEERKAYVKKKQREQNKARERVKEERRNITAMKRAAKEKVLERLRDGSPDGAYEVQVRKGNQTLKWRYEIKDGQALVRSKSTGWVPREARR